MRVSPWGHAHSARLGSFSVRHEQDGVAVVIEARMNAGEMSLGQLDQFVLILADDGFSARTRDVCLHDGAFPSGDRSYFAALAAAFMCFLCARTFPIDWSSTISATEICAPAWPKSPAAARQPFGVTPYCLPSRAKKICAFTSPKPGNPLIRRSSSFPSGSPAVHNPVVS